MTKVMTTYYSLSAKTELSYRNLSKLISRDVSHFNFVTSRGVSYRCKSVDFCRNVRYCLGFYDLHRRYMVSRKSVFGGYEKSHKPNPFAEPATKDFHSFCSAPYSSGVVSDLSVDAPVQEESIKNHDLGSNEKNLERTLKLLSGSCYLPHPDKERTGGEDAHFICINEQAVGVADGVGGWAELGIDAGEYARELMSHSVTAIQEEPKGAINPSRVLEKAYLSTKAQGSSTACIIALTEQNIFAANLGDSGFMVVRDGCTIFQSPPQQHSFNFPYQLENGNRSDLPCTAQVFSVPVSPGDVIVVGTDGLFDNLYDSEVASIVDQTIRAGLGPEIAARKISELAQIHGHDRNRQTPFSSAAQDAGFRYFGGKLDDITVVVSYITGRGP